MARIKLDLPAAFLFQTQLHIRITDLNYGGHVGNDSILTLAHEARVQFLKAFGLSELDFAGVGLIMADAAIEFKQEVFYGDRLQVSLAVSDAGTVGFDLFYLFEKLQEDGSTNAVALVKTGMVCYDYEKKKVVRVPAAVKEKWGLQ